MKELKEISFNGTKLALEDCRVSSAILPQRVSEMGRDIEFSGEVVVEGAVYAHNLTIRKGPVTVRGATYTSNDLLVKSEVAETVLFAKAVASAGSVTAVPSGRCVFGADVNASSVRLRNVFVAANVFGAEVVLENSVVLGGVFATKSLSLTDCVVGTFNTPRANLAGRIMLLLPSAFAIEPFSCAPGTKIENLTLADLGNLMKGFPEAEKSGKIDLDPERDLQRTVLADENGNQQQLYTYTVGAKVLAADLLDIDKLQNHFLLNAGMLGAQLLRNYDFGCGKDGAVVGLTQGDIAEFFFRVISDDIQIKSISGSFTMAEVAKAYATD